MTKRDEHGWPLPESGAEGLFDPVPAKPRGTAEEAMTDAVRSVTCPFCEAEFVDPTLHDANVEIHRLRKATPPAAVQGEAVPREPTEAMLRALPVADGEDKYLIRGRAFDCWTTMWDAAHPVTEEGERT